jgi:hypothetical protein
VPRKALDCLVLSEHSWRKVKHWKNFDFGTIVVSFAKAVEFYLPMVVSSRLTGVTLGKITEYVKGSRRWSELYDPLDQLNDLRNDGGAHPGQRLKDDAYQARGLALDIFLLAGKLSQGHR